MARPTSFVKDSSGWISKEDAEQRAASVRFEKRERGVTPITKIIAEHGKYTVYYRQPKWWEGV